MTVACPYCRTQVPVDAWGNSACGHLRGTPGTPPAPPSPPIQPASPGAPAPTAPSSPAWGAPPSQGQGWGQPSGPTGWLPQATRSTGWNSQPGSQTGWAPQPGSPVGPTGWNAQPGSPTGWGAQPPRRGRRGCGCIVAIVLLGLVAVGVAVLAASLPTADAGPRPGDIPPAVVAPTGSVTRGTPTTLVSQAVAAGGAATLSVPAGRPLAGLVIDIPKGAYAARTTFRVTATPIKVSGFGGLVTPISDLITVDNGGGYASHPITITIPAKVTPGSFAMGVYLLDDGSLEPMPLVSEDATSVTIATRHFSSFFLTEIAKAALPTDIGTGFRVGVDDFQDVNYGDYVAPWGHCAGQSIATMWYFEERKLAQGAPSLFGRYDNDGISRTPTRWEDDEIYYRLTGTVQRDMQDADIQYATWALIYLRNAMVDEYQWLAFRYAMLVTGLPQDVVMKDTTGTTGHNMIVYAATPTGLWVADPNKPGQLRTIEWDAARQAFKPYLSGTTAKSSKYQYDKIGFFGKTAFTDWARVGRRWSEVDDGTIGDDRFPDGKLAVVTRDASGSPVSETDLHDGFIFDTDSPVIHFVADSPSLKTRLTAYSNGAAHASVEGRYLMLVLPPGRVDLDVFIEAWRENDWQAVDYRRFKVITPAPSMSPVEPTPEPTTPPTAKPSARPRATPAPAPTFDCSVKPVGQVQTLNWSLHCKQIGGG